MLTTTKNGLRTAYRGRAQARQTINAATTVHLLLFNSKVPPAGRVKLEPVNSTRSRVFLIVFCGVPKKNANFYFVPVDDVVIAGGCDKVWRRFLLARKF